MHARSVGEVRLVSSDPDVPLDIDFRHFEDPSDMQRMHAILGEVQRIATHSAFDGLCLGRVAPTEGDLDSETATDEWILRSTVTGHHASGTCRMGPAASGCVVDEAGRVYGVDGLRVVDASIMPDCPRANTNITTMMLAEKLADRILATRS